MVAALLGCWRQVACWAAMFIGWFLVVVLVAGAVLDCPDSGFRDQLHGSWTDWLLARLLSCVASLDCVDELAQPQCSIQIQRGSEKLGVLRET